MLLWRWTWGVRFSIISTHFYHRLLRASGFVVSGHALGYTIVGIRVARHSFAAGVRTALQEAVRLDPADSHSWMALGYLEMGAMYNPDAASKHFAQASSVRNIFCVYEGIHIS